MVKSTWTVTRVDVLDGNGEGQFKVHVKVFGLGNWKDELSYYVMEGGKEHGVS